MKWTMLVNHSPYERTTRELLRIRRERLKQVEEDFIQSESANAPRRLHAMVPQCEELVGLYDLGDYTRGKSLSSIDTIKHIVEPERSRGGEEEEEEEARSSSSGSSNESNLHPDMWRREEKRKEMFAVSLSIDEEVENMWLTGSSSSSHLKSEQVAKSESFDDLEVHKTSTLGEGRKDSSKWDYKVFKRFMNKTDDEVRQTWEKDKKKPKILNVIDTDEAMVNEIAEELCDWAESEGLHSSVLTVETISDLFRFKFTDNVVVESMMMNVRQLRDIPAKICGPAESTRAELYRQILWDKMAYERTSTEIAFLSSTGRKTRVKTDPIKQWVESDYIPQELITTESLFANFLKSDILEKFAIWLLENPDAHQPKYLKQIGFINFVRDKHGGVQRIMMEKEKRMNRERFQASKFVTKENTFLEGIKRMSEIRRLIPPSYRGSLTSF